MPVDKDGEEGDEQEEDQEEAKETKLDDLEGTDWLVNKFKLKWLF